MSRENQSSEYTRYEKFYKLVKDWTVSDYFTPGVKAEVIIDMLISEFVEDLIGSHYWGDMQGEHQVTLLMKEFPIQTNEENNRNAKVDYLVSVDWEKLVLVELKTTDDSFDKNQLERTKAAVNTNVQDLIDFYNRIMGLKGQNTLDHKKYQYACDKFKFEDNMSMMQSEDGILKNLQLDYLYILLTDGKKLKENIPEEEKRLILEYYWKEGIADKKYKAFQRKLENEQRLQLWEEVSGILAECAKKV